MADASYQSKVYRKQGGAEFVVASSGQVTVESGGELEVESGGVLDVESGGQLRIAGTQITPTAAQFNYLSGVTAGTAAANKAAVLGANRNLNILTLPASGLRIGTSSGIPVAATAAELNTLNTVAAGTAKASKAAVLGANRNLDILTLPVSGLRIGTSSGIPVAATAAELNTLNAVTAGTAAASKAVVLGANRNLDRLTLSTGGLRIGTSSGTAVTATAAELNVLNGVTAGTAVANKALVLGAGRTIGNDVNLSSGGSLGVVAGGYVVNRAYIEVVTSTAAKALAGQGISVLNSVGAVVHSLPAPSPGQHKEIVQSSTSTTVTRVGLVSGGFLSSAGSSHTHLAFNALAERVMLTGLSTSLWAVMVNQGVVLSTST